MNELQLSLLGLGLFAIALVVVYNRWLERKHRQQNAPESVVEVETPVEETLGGRQEPSWDHGDGAIDPEAVDSLPVEPRLSERPTAAPAEPLEPIAALSEAESWVDAIATLRFYEPRTAGSIRETLNQMGAERFERVEFYSGDAWHRADALPADALVSNLRGRLQLASRTGPVSAERLHQWIRSLESLAQMLSAGLSVESESSLVDRATNLDAFCVRVDTLISLNLKFKHAAAAAFDKLSAEAGRFALMGEFPNYARVGSLGQVDFQVQAAPNTGCVSLVLDFPHVQGPDTVVSEMLDLARILAQELDADIVDDGGRAMSEEGMGLLVHQVIRLKAMLQAQGIEPGSALARRLFS